jgi:hypothetical protein
MGINLKTYGYWNANITRMYVLNCTFSIAKTCLVIGPVPRQVEYVSCQPPSILAVVPGITGRVTNPTAVTWCMGHIYEELSRSWTIA